MSSVLRPGEESAQLHVSFCMKEIFPSSEKSPKETVLHYECNKTLSSVDKMQFTFQVSKTQRVFSFWLSVSIENWRKDESSIEHLREKCPFNNSFCFPEKGDLIDILNYTVAPEILKETSLTVYFKEADSSSIGERNFRAEMHRLRSREEKGN